MGKVTTREVTQIIRWTMVGVGSFFIYSYLNSKLGTMYPDHNSQLILGILLLFGAAYLFDLTKYN